MSSTFSADVRVLTCPKCGAPLHVSPAGGQFNCDYCRNLVEVEPRAEVISPAPLMTEEERVKALWEQTERHESTILKNLPIELATVLKAGQMTEGRVSEARKLWQSYCEQAKSGDMKAAEYAIVLTGLLQGYFAVSGDMERVRALLESTLEDMPAPARKQVIRCRLARTALMEGEVDAAKAWLADCEPAPLDLEADTDYRLTTAFLSTFDQDFARVLSLLGPTNHSIPTAVGP